jgi:hypothetical protein
MTEMQPPANANVRSPSYFVAQANAPCPHCGLSTRLLALAVPPRHETLQLESAEWVDVDLDDSTSDLWQPESVNAFVFYIEYLPNQVQRRLSRLLPFFRLAYSPSALNSYWANHCEHCGKLLGDHELHCEPEGAFFPVSELAAADIQLLIIKEPFEAEAAGFALEPEFFHAMRVS